jgi:hypothetical protein
MFTGRIPFVADADVSAWIKAIDRVIALRPLGCEGLLRV